MDKTTHLLTENRQDADLLEIAVSFVAARRQARPLAAFPGTPPNRLASAYRIQDFAIDLWGERVGGWKVGRIPVALEEGLGIDRLAGPIFESAIHWPEDGTVLEMPMFVGGFAAIEAEFVAVIERDSPVNQLTWSLEEALAMIGDLRIGMEIASSPLATINELGPAVVVSDFGNNFGLIVGPSINNWRSRSLESMHSSASIDQHDVGTGGAFNLTGGFIRSVQFLLELAARRNRPLRAGDVVATGQTTGIHDVRVGQVGRVDFGDDGSLGARMLAAKPSA